MWRTKRMPSNRKAPSILFNFKPMKKREPKLSNLVYNYCKIYTKLKRVYNYVQPNTSITRS